MQKHAHLVDLIKSVPKLGYRKKEAKGAAPGSRKKASSGDQGTQKAEKAIVAPIEK